MIIDQICSSQNGDKHAVVELIEKFTPILRKYARKLDVEDAYNDLVLEFLEIIQNLDCSTIRQKGDGAMVNYLSRSIYHAYIKLLNGIIKNKSQTISIDELGDKVFYGNYFQNSDIFYFELPPNLLTKNEEKIFLWIHYFGYSVAEIAQFTGTSRQNINQRKRNAEQKLRKYFSMSKEF